MRGKERRWWTSQQWGSGSRSRKTDLIAKKAERSGPVSAGRSSATVMSSPLRAALCPRPARERMFIKDMLTYAEHISCNKTGALCVHHREFPQSWSEHRCCSQSEALGGRMRKGSTAGEKIQPGGAGTCPTRGSEFHQGFSLKVPSPAHFTLLPFPALLLDDFGP